MKRALNTPHDSLFKQVLRTRGPSRDKKEIWSVTAAEFLVKHLEILYDHLFVNDAHKRRYELVILNQEFECTIWFKDIYTFMQQTTHEMHTFLRWQTLHGQLAKIQLKIPSLQLFDDARFLYSSARTVSNPEKYTLQLVYLYSSECYWKNKSRDPLLDPILELVFELKCSDQNRKEHFVALLNKRLLIPQLTEIVIMYWDGLAPTLLIARHWQI